MWQPDSAFVRKTNFAAYMKWLEKRGHGFGQYDELWNWSVQDLEGFWGSIWKYFEVAEEDYQAQRDQRKAELREVIQQIEALGPA